ncbi:MAG: hypothetical protein M3070_00310 [Actinomycetota bacterium]|nr:hypothetical protein [Actinomycetota bacterium]
MKRYDARVSREGGYWVAVVPGVRGGATESRRLSELDPELRDLLSGLLDAEPERIELDWHYEDALPATAFKAVAEYHEAAEWLAAAKRRYEAAQRSRRAAPGRRLGPRLGAPHRTLVSTGVAAAVTAGAASADRVGEPRYLLDRQRRRVRADPDVTLRRHCRCVSNDLRDEERVAVAS